MRKWSLTNIVTVAAILGFATFCLAEKMSQVPLAPTPLRPQDRVAVAVYSSAQGYYARAYVFRLDQLNRWVLDNHSAIFRRTSSAARTAVQPAMLLDYHTIAAHGQYSSSVAAQLALKQAILGYTPEDAANRSVDGTLAANSDAYYPSQKAVATAIGAVNAALRAVMTNRSGVPVSMSGNGTTIPTWTTGSSAASLCEKADGSIGKCFGRLSTASSGIFCTTCN